MLRRRLVGVLAALALATVTTLPAVAPAPDAVPVSSSTPSPSESLSPPAPLPSFPGFERVEPHMYWPDPVWRDPPVSRVGKAVEAKAPKPKPAPKPAAKPKPRAPRSCWPVRSSRAYLSQSFHRGHPAIDIAAPSGSRIVPIRSGTTVFAGWRNNDGGYQVWVSHGRGLYSAYYHMRAESSFRGERVTGCREVIGYVGMTGHATGPHLHFEVWKGFPWRSGSYRVNPRRYLP